MIPIAEEIGRYVAAQLGVEFGGVKRWGVFAHWEPDKKGDGHDNVITVYGTGGDGPDTDELDPRPTFQVRTRSVSFADGQDKQEEIRDLLILTQPFVTEHSTFVGIVATGDILPIGKDDNGRFLLTANYRAIKERT